MSIDEQVRNIIGDGSDADKFLRLFGAACHGIDDIVDGESNPEAAIRTFYMLTAALSSNFYQAHVRELYPVIGLIANQYADSVRWERREDWRAQWADVLRNAANELTLAVVGICGGYDAQRSVSAQLREYAYQQHHDEKGVPH